MAKRDKPLHGMPYPARLVAFDVSPPRVPDEVVSEIARQVEVINNSKRLGRDLRPGELVKFSLGSLESVAEVVRQGQASRVRVLLEFLGRLVYADVPSNRVRKTSSDGPPANRSGRPPRRTRGNGRWIIGFEPGT